MRFRNTPAKRSHRMRVGRYPLSSVHRHRQKRKVEVIQHFLSHHRQAPLNRVASTGLVRYSNAAIGDNARLSDLIK
jgi:hypothetical protein